MAQSRRNFLKRSSGLAFGAALIPTALIETVEASSHRTSNLIPINAAKDENLWYPIQQSWKTSKDFINLENGYYSPTPTQTIEAQYNHVQSINEAHSFYMRTKQTADRESTRGLMAQFAGCSGEELVSCRNTTEALDTVIQGIDLEIGEEVIISDQDYGSMVEAFRMKEKRFGTRVKVVNIPLHPKSDEEIVGIYEAAISPKTKLLLVTHMINLTGQVLPARKICDMAHKKGVEVIIDAAHSFAHLDFKIDDLGGDYFGTSLHKWLCAPVGTGMMQMKKDKIAKVWPLFGDVNQAVDNIRKFEHQGTQPIATYLAIGNAIRFHNAIGSKRKEERLRYLKNYWVNEVKDLPKVILNTPFEDHRTGAIANIGIEGISPGELAEQLYHKHKIYTVAIDTEAVKGVRVTPHLYNTLKDLDRFVEAINSIRKN